MVLKAPVYAAYEDVSLVLHSALGEVTLTHPCGFNERRSGSIVAIPTLRGFLLGFVDGDGYVDYTSSTVVCLAPLAAIHAMRLFDGIASLEVEGDDEVKEFNQLALVCNGYLDGRSAAAFVEKLGIPSTAVFMEALHRQPGLAELQEIFDRFTVDGGDEFRMSVRAMMPYMIAYGDIGPEEARWLEEVMLLAS